jgi:HD-GYP domain-containing protein (c-di-GMP phosphodiesterase class II)
VASHGLGDYSKPVSLGESVVGRAVLDRRPCPISDISNSPYKNSEFARAHGLRSLVSVPLIFKDRAVGGMTVYSSSVDSFGANEVGLLLAMGSQVAAVLENGLLLRDTVSTLVSLARAVEAKDPYTHGHSERVTAYAAILAERIGVSSRDVEMIKQVGPMHDIGKIGVSESVLLKPAELNEAEWDAMRRHPVIGENIVSSIRRFQPGLFLVRNHHERIDGRGYPDGLSGEEIPLTVRIVAISDAYDAMTTTRPYRGALAPEAALSELEANAGTQFDADLVGAFRELADAGAMTLPE